MTFPSSCFIVIVGSIIYLWSGVSRLLLAIVNFGPAHEKHFSVHLIVRVLIFISDYCFKSVVSAESVILKMRSATC